MSKKSKLLVAHWPMLCDDCGRGLAEKVTARADLDVITCYCPHNELFVMAYCGQLDATRAVLRWDITGPLPESEAVQMINRLAKESATFENLDSSRVH